MITITIFKFVAPFLVGWISRMGWESYTDRVEARNYRRLEQQKRVQLLAATPADELLEELSKRDHEISR